jgi:Skp family chaperone for outer membrane proteins
MLIRLRPISLCLVATLGLCLSRPASAQPVRPPVAPAPAAQPGARIAVVNPSRVFQEMKETRDLRAKLETRRQELSTAEQEKRKSIDDLKRNRANLKPDSPQYNDLSTKLDKENADFQAWGQVTRIQAEREQKQMMKTLFDKIQGAVGQVAQEQGIDLVLADQGQEVPSVEDLNFDQLRLLLNQRNVLFASKRVDISERVLAVLDAQYAKEGPK